MRQINFCGFLCWLNIIIVTKNWVLYQNKIGGFYLSTVRCKISKKFNYNNIFISDETLIFIDYNTLLLAVVLSRIIVSCNQKVCMYQSIKRHLFSLEWRIEARYDYTLSTWYHDSCYTLYITNYTSRKKAMLTMIRWHFICI